MYDWLVDILRAPRLQRQRDLIRNYTQCSKRREEPAVLDCFVDLSCFLDWARGGSSGSAVHVFEHVCSHVDAVVNGN